MRPLGHFGLVCPGSQASDQGAYPPRVSGVGAQSADLGARQPVLRCVLGLLILHSQSRGCGGRGARPLVHSAPTYLATIF